MPVDAQVHPPRFRLWIRRQNLPEGAYSLRFEAQEGKGILRVARPGVLIDPPARPVGIEERLTPQQLRSTRFILVWDGGRARQGHLLNRIEEAQVERIEVDRWHDMEIVVDGGFRYASLPLSTPAVEARPAKPKARRPSLSELRQALDSITVHSEDPEDADSALASLTGPSQEGAPTLADAPRPGIAGRKPSPVEPQPPPPAALASALRLGKALANLADYEVIRPRSAPDPTVPSRRVLPFPPPPPPGWQNDAPTVVLSKELETAILPLAAAEVEDAESQDLALGEADPGIEHAESLALGEADDDLDHAETLEFVARPDAAAAPSPPAGEAPPPVRSASATSPSSVSAHTGGGAAAFFAQFNDAEDEAIFSIDLPSYRQSTEHVTVRRGDEDRDGAFASDELPPLRGLSVDAGVRGPEGEPAPEAEVFPALPEPTDEAFAALPEPPAPRDTPPPAAQGLVRSRSVHDLEDAAVELPDSAAPAAATSAPAEMSVPGRPPESPAERWKNATTLTPAEDGDGIVHRSPTTLVRHLRRRVEEQRARIAELESRIAVLEGKG